MRCPSRTPGSLSEPGATVGPPAPRKPIDPSLPPDHPLEPGSAGRSRDAAVRCRTHRRVGSRRRIEAAGYSGSGRRQAGFHRCRPPRCAGRRCGIAARAKRWPIQRAEGARSAGKTRPSALRKLAVAAAVVVIVVGGFHIVSRLFEDGGSNAPAPAKRSRARAIDAAGADRLPRTQSARRKRGRNRRLEGAASR